MKQMTSTANARSGSPSGSPLELADLLRLDAGSRLDAVRQVEWGQFFTGATVARLMAGLFDAPGSSLHLLDAGAGVGSLTAAFVTQMCGRKVRPQSLQVTVYEADEALLPYLQETLSACREHCHRAGVSFEAHLCHEDFITEGVDRLSGGILSGGLFTPAACDGASCAGASFDCAILNPPYRKIRSSSEWRRALSAVGIEASNLYTAFAWLAMRLLKPGGELVAITPRSFCNGPYFKPFRASLALTMSLRRFHLFESRVEAFKQDEVLQENIIFHAVKRAGEDVAEAPVTISSSLGPEDEGATSLVVPLAQLIRPGDPDAFINLVPDAWGQRVAEQVGALPCSLKELGLTVSTGRVVDFRAKDSLRALPGERAGEVVVPLIYPLHFDGSFISWPKDDAKKPNALAVSLETLPLLVEAGVYVLVKRFTSKEQTRRIVAAIYEPERIKLNGNGASKVGFENHLNYFHEGGSGLSKELATGLAAFLNSTLVDAYFRQFNGHTQVNATDLRSLKYPPRPALEALGRHIVENFGAASPPQSQLDALLMEEIFAMPDDKNAINPVQAKNRIGEALLILKALKLDRQQQNERSALALLALLDLTPGKSWEEAANPLRGIRSILDFCREVYGKAIAENTRETYRRQTIHQFMQAGLVVLNPDNPARPVNSPHNVYQVTPEALQLARVFGLPGWETSLATFAASQEAIQARALRERTLHRIPVTTPAGETFTLSPGGQNLLIKEILEQFCPRYTPGGIVLYLGDADEKWAFYDAPYLKNLGVEVDEHGKMPDVVIHHVEKNWLVLVEAVTSHGPVDLKRHVELKELFSGSSAGLVFVTAFLDRAAMGKYLRDLAWETEVWVADAPDHLIHFNGERFLGPYAQ